MNIIIIYNYGTMIFMTRVLKMSSGLALLLLVSIGSNACNTEYVAPEDGGALGVKHVFFEYHNISRCHRIKYPKPGYYRMDGPIDAMMALLSAKRAAYGKYHLRHWSSALFEETNDTMKYIPCQPPYLEIGDHFIGSSTWDIDDYRAYIINHYVDYGKTKVSAYYMNEYHYILNGRRYSPNYIRDGQEMALYLNNPREYHPEIWAVTDEDDLCYNSTSYRGFKYHIIFDEDIIAYLYQDYQRPVNNWLFRVSSGLPDPNVTEDQIEFMKQFERAATIPHEVSHTWVGGIDQHEIHDPIEDWFKCTLNVYAHQDIAKIRDIWGEYYNLSLNNLARFCEEHYEMIYTHVDNMSQDTYK